MDSKTAKLALEDGTILTGRVFGSSGTRQGEVVFTTSITGYQEILTDPSYTGQIVTMTYPLIGNYGVNLEDLESAKPSVAGFVVKELSHRTSNFRATGCLSDWLAQYGIVGIEGLDTRALTRKLRVQGAMNGCLSSEILDDIELVKMARSCPKMLGLNLVDAVAPKESYAWADGYNSKFSIDTRKRPARFNVVAIDCGAKRNILRNLVEAGCRVTVVPPSWTVDQIRQLKPDGIFVSNGPGDPGAVLHTTEVLRQLIGKVPIFGICLGHQLLGLAAGGERFKLKFGHRGTNQPVMNLKTGRVEITSQNHGFAIVEESIKKVGCVATHINLNDKTLEGFTAPDRCMYAVQYHPEASPGPHDATYLFDLFTRMMETGHSPTAEEMDEAQRHVEAEIQKLSVPAK
jgi:carbamoyl-phosphate synthase small subunit